MIYGVKDQPVDEYFTVVDSNGNLISGIDSSTFIVYVYDPTSTEVSLSINGSIIDLGNGHYKYTFIPNQNGTWYVNIIHPIYFSWGKSDDIYVTDADLTSIYNIVSRTLGLTHHNIYIDQPIYGDEGSLISARVRTYKNAADVGTENNIIETYRIEADEVACGQFSFWKQVKL